MDISFVSNNKINNSLGIFFIFDDLKFSQDFSDYKYEKEINSLLKTKKNFKGKKGQIISYLPASISEFKEIILVGLGRREELDIYVSQLAGSKLSAYLGSNEAENATVCFNLEDNPKATLQSFVKNFYEGMALRNYKFRKYFVDKKNDNKLTLTNVAFWLHNFEVYKKSIEETKILIEGIYLTRDLVSEPPNVLYPKTFADACKKLEKSGLKIKIFNEKMISKLGMGALLGVGQGSVNESYFVVLEWNGNTKSKNSAPIAFVGKGVTFDTGGISLKTAPNMSDMKYDMAGAGTVVGLMKTLADRKAKVNAVGVIGLVENMPSGSAQRPGDVVTSMSGQTIEIDNTDAEGRLVLADMLWYTQQTYKPKFIVNLATLTGAIVVALGENCYAGMFSNDDNLAEQLYNAGIKSGDKVWRFPLSDFYDKQITSEIADMRNTGTGRGGGSITAAQFLQRFVNKYPWAHLDIAGMAWDKSGADINPKGATAFGVRLLNQLVVDHYETN